MKYGITTGRKHLLQLVVFLNLYYTILYRYASIIHVSIRTNYIRFGEVEVRFICGQGGARYIRFGEVEVRFICDQGGARYIRFGEVEVRFICDQGTARLKIQLDDKRKKSYIRTSTPPSTPTKYLITNLILTSIDHPSSICLER